MVVQPPVVVQPSRRSEMAAESENVQRVREYLEAIEQGGDAGRFLHPEAGLEQLPSRLYPTGARVDVRGAQEAAEKGKKILRSQRFQVRSAVAQGDRVAMEVDWRGTLAVPMGQLQPGAELHAQFGMFVQLRDGRILAQRNYDCYDPF